VPPEKGLLPPFLSTHLPTFLFTKYATIIYTKPTYLPAVQFEGGKAAIAEASDALVAQVLPPVVLHYYYALVHCYDLA
jgi:hypothetical protein